MAFINFIERETSETIPENRLDIIDVSGCSNCKPILRRIDTIRRADGSALQLVVCGVCKHKWKELWIQ